MTPHIEKIRQKNKNVFTIEWADGKIVDYRLGDLQKNCPCAKCYDTATGKRASSAPPVDEDVEAIKIENIGAYALRIDFTSGCSYGIYRLDQLYLLKLKS